MKKLISLLLALALGVSAIAATVVLAKNGEDDIMLISENSSFELVVNGTVIDQPQAIYNEGNVMIPLRKVCETLGLTVNWDAETNMITIEKLPVYITCYPNADGYTFARTAPIFLGEAPILIEGTTFVPVSFIDKILQGTSQLSGNTITVMYGEQPSLTANAVIVEVADNQILVNDETRGEVLVNITEETELTNSEGEPAGFDDLKADASVDVVYGEAMTRSIPPMTNGVKIIIK